MVTLNNIKQLYLLVEQMCLNTPKGRISQISAKDFLKNFK